MVDRYDISKEKSVKYFDAKNSYGHSMSQPLPIDEIKVDRNDNLEDILNTLDDSGIGYFVEDHLKNHDEINEKTKNFNFVLRIKLAQKMNLVNIWMRLNQIIIHKIKR